MFGVPIERTSQATFWRDEETYVSGKWSIRYKRESAESEADGKRGLSKAMGLML